jgi:hypothetical protein
MHPVLTEISEAMAGLPMMHREVLTLRFEESSRYLEQFVPAFTSRSRRLAYVALLLEPGTALLSASLLS